jgi:hypothetical protein
MAVTDIGNTLANSSPVNTRRVKDGNYIVVKALPNAANTIYTNNIDLINTVPYPTTQYVIAQVICGAGTGANNKNINCVLQETEANSDGTANSANWANAAFVKAPLLVNADANNAGHTASYANILLPPGVKRFIRAGATGEANGGDSSDANLTLQLLF